MIADSDRKGEHLIRSVKPKLSIVFCKVEASQVEFPFPKYRDAAREVVLQAGLGVQPDFCAGLRSFKSCLSGVNLRKEEPGSNCDIGLKSCIGIS